MSFIVHIGETCYQHTSQNIPQYLPKQRKSIGMYWGATHANTHMHHSLMYVAPGSTLGIVLIGIYPQAWADLDLLQVYNHIATNTQCISSCRVAVWTSLTQLGNFFEVKVPRSVGCVIELHLSSLNAGKPSSQPVSHTTWSWRNIYPAGGAGDRCHCSSATSASPPPQPSPRSSPTLYCCTATDYHRRRTRIRKL